MAETLLPEFKLHSSNMSYNWGKDYHYIRKSDTTSVELKIGIFKSAEEAENIINEFFDFNSGRPNPSPYKGNSVGNKFWYSEDNYTLTLIFIRKNGIFIIWASQKYPYLIEN
ncbi:MAG: hypothetical protein HC906_06495 [Bacteroidales bacterium]|nr:hypothetical protein [Bacteroidales bacterium]